MPAVPSFLSNWYSTYDADSFFAYQVGWRRRAAPRRARPLTGAHTRTRQTVKLVSIRDRWLGLMHYAFQLAIFIYIIIFVIIVGKGYMAFDDPVGALKYTVRQVGRLPLFSSSPRQPSNETTTRSAPID